MKKRSVLEIIVVCFGLYCLVVSIQYLPVIGVMFAAGEMSEYITSMLLYRFFQLLVPVVSLAVSFVFLTKTQAIVSFLESRTLTTSESVNSPSASGRMSFWITLLGLYYLVSSASRLLSIIPRFFLDYSGAPFLVEFIGPEFWSELITLIISVFLIRKSRRIESFIQKKASKDAQP